MRDLARYVVRECALEYPSKVTYGPGHVGDDGSPEQTAEFNAWVFGSPFQADGRDPEFIGVTRSDVIQGYLRWPNRAALVSMRDSPERKIARLGRIVELIVNGARPGEAAIEEGAHPDDADDTARRALETFLGRRGELALRLPAGRANGVEYDRGQQPTARV